MISFFSLAEAKGQHVTVYHLSRQQHGTDVSHLNPQRSGDQFSVCQDTGYSILDKIKFFWHS